MRTAAQPASPRPSERPTAFIPRAGMVAHGALAAGEVLWVELRVVEAGPDGRDVQGVGGDADAEAAVHVGGELEACRRVGCGGARARRRAQREPREAVADALQLLQRRQHDVHVRVAAVRLVQPRHLVCADRLDRNLLRDDRLARPVAKGDVRVVRLPRARRKGAERGRRRRRGLHGQREQRHVVLLGQAQLDRRRAERGPQRARERRQRHLEIDRVLS